MSEMSKSNLFKWHHYQAGIILHCVHWYCTYPLSYRQVAEMVNERGMTVTAGWSLYPGFIPPGDQIVSKTYMTRVEGENTRLRH